MTPRAEQILGFIREHIKALGYPPSMRAIGAAVGLSSPASVHRYVSALKQQGRLHVIQHGGHVLRMEVEGD